MSLPFLAVSVPALHDTMCIRLLLLLASGCCLDCRSSFTIGQSYQKPAFVDHRAICNVRFGERIHNYTSTGSGVRDYRYGFCVNNFDSCCNLFIYLEPQKMIMNTTRGQSNLTKCASRGAHSPVRDHPRGSKFVPLNSWGRGSY